MVKKDDVRVVKLALQEFIEEGGFDAPIKAYTKKTIQDIFAAIDLPVYTHEDVRGAKNLIAFGRRIKKRCDAFYDNVWRGVGYTSAVSAFAFAAWAVTTWLGK